MGRYCHMTKPESKELVEELQRLVDERWEWLLMMDEQQTRTKEKEAKVEA